ncbi:hypothetical protein C8F01DRAFT_1352004 [Mycena amicta]|nr:hypothetical protein C8F01DRAFT_1352004 [Mycena amicta]
MASRENIVDVITKRGPTDACVFEYLSDLPDSALMQIALVSKHHWRAVLETLETLAGVDESDRRARKSRPRAAFFGHVSSKLPLEVWDRVVRCGDLVSMARLGSTCTWMHKIAAEAVEQLLGRAFTSVGLPFSALRFGLVTSGAVMSGWAAANLLHPGDGWAAFADLDYIDFYVGHRSADDFVDFCEMALGYIEYEAVAPRKDMVHVSHVRLLVSTRPTAVSTRLAIHFIHFDGVALTVPHARFACSMIALPNHVYLSKERASAAGVLLREEADAISCGFTVCSLDDAMLVDGDAYGLQTTAGSDTAVVVLCTPPLGKGIVSKRPIQWRLHGFTRPELGWGPFFVKLVDTPMQSDDWLKQAKATWLLEPMGSEATYHDDGRVEGRSKMGSHSDTAFLRAGPSTHPQHGSQPQEPDTLRSVGLFYKSSSPRMRLTLDCTPMPVVHVAANAAILLVSLTDLHGDLGHISSCDLFGNDWAAEGRLSWRSVIARARHDRLDAAHPRFLLPANLDSSSTYP